MASSRTNATGILNPITDCCLPPTVSYRAEPVLLAGATRKACEISDNYLAYFIFSLSRHWLDQSKFTLWPNPLLIVHFIPTEWINRASAKTMYLCTIVVSYRRSNDYIGEKSYYPKIPAGDPFWRLVTAIISFFNSRISKPILSDKLPKSYRSRLLRAK